MKKLRLKTNETFITIICMTDNGVEWRVVKQDVNIHEVISEGKSKINDLNLSNAIIPINNLPNDLLENILGDVFLSIPSKIILTKINNFPSKNLNEIDKMAKIQIDKISPFSSEKILYSNEILENDDNSSNVIMMSTQKKYIDEITRYVERNIFVKGVDARIMGWLELINQKNELSSKDEIILLNDNIDFVLILKKNYKIELIRPLYIDLNTYPHRNSVIEELLYEISYTLQNREKIYERISIWAYNDSFSNESFSNRIEEALNIKTCLNFF